MTSLDRGLDVLSYVTEHGPSTAAEIAAAVRMPLSTTYRYLAALRASGYLADYDDHVDLGLRAMRGLRPEVLHRCIAATSAPVMFELVDRVEESVLLTVRDGWNATCIELVEPRRAVRFSFRQGVSLALHKGASAKPLLAYMDGGFIHRYLEARVGWAAARESAAVWDGLAAVRSTGIAITESELDTGAVGVGGPVFRDGTIAACISVVGPSARLGRRRLGEVVADVRRAGDQLSGLLTMAESARRPGPAGPDVPSDDHRRAGRP